MFELEELLKRTGLLSADDSPRTVFSAIVNLWRRITNPAAAEVRTEITAAGLPVVTPRLEFDATTPSATEQQIVPHDDALALLNDVLKDIDLTLWLVLDRLDEAFAGMPAAEIPALRALLRTYLDLSPYEHVELKLFVRRDLFRRIIAGGFVNLTHVNAKKVEIEWDEDSLAHLLFRRVSESTSFVQAAGLDAGNQQALFDALLPEQIDAGGRKPNTWRWMMSRIRDGNDVKPPRNLIDLLKKTQEHQIRREEREHNEFTPGVPLLNSESFKVGLRALSTERVEDTLIAEAGEQAGLIERFRNGKAEHNEESLSEQLSLTGNELRDAIRFLREIGLLEPFAATYKIPMLYRDGLNITQGKAFDPGAPEEVDIV
jgi:hypothetical protein